MKRTAALLSLFAVFALGAFAVGCGGDDNDGGSSAGQPGSTASQSDQEAVEALAAKVGEYTNSGNAKKMCSLFEAERLGQAMGSDQCVALFARALKNRPKKENFEVEGIEVEGDIAKVQFGFGETYFEKIDGTWYLGTPDVGADDQSE